MSLRVRRSLGDIYPHPAGYLMVYVGLDYPNNRHGYLLQHRHVMEERLGRTLGRTEQVHHINGVKTDNRPENLQLVTDSDHRLRELAQVNGLDEEFVVSLWASLKRELRTNQPDVTIRELALILRAYDEWNGR